MRNMRENIVKIICLSSKVFEQTN